jgi:hypothetical protein
MNQQTANQASTRRRNVGSYALCTLLCVSATMNLLQSERLRAARGREERPAIGTRVPSIDLIASDATSTHIDYPRGGLPTIFYYFSASCSWCERNWESVRTLADGTRGRYRVVALTTNGEDVRRTRASGLPLPTFWGLSEQQRAAYQFRGTPHTLLVSADGRVVRSWSGAYARDVKTDLERYFQVSLPELPAQRAGH